MAKTNLILRKYVEKFDELPFLLTTQTYDSVDYQVLMMMAIDRGTPLTEEEIADFFHNQYDIVKEGEKGFTKFGKN